MKCILFIILFFYAAVNKPFAQINVHQDDIINIGAMVRHYADKTGLLTVDSIAKLPDDSFFVSTSGTPNFQMTKATIWTRFLLSPHNTHLLLEVGNRRLDKIFVYTKNHNDWYIQKSGDHFLSSSTLQYQSRFNLFDIPPSVVPQEFFLEIESDSPMLGAFQTFAPIYSFLYSVGI